MNKGVHVSNLLKMRDYQAASITALNAKFKDGLDRVAVVLPTGGGKTVVFSHLSNGYVTDNPGRRVLILAHTDELVKQAAKKIKDVAPQLSVGIVKGAIRQTKATVIVASVQSLRSEGKRNQIKDVGLVIVDECHHATAKTYRDILKHYGCLSGPCEPCDGRGEFPHGRCADCAGTGTAQTYPGAAKAAGFTATLMRSDKASLAQIWQDVAYRKDISFMIRAGYLLAPRGKRIVVDDLDLANVKKSGGDFQSGDLGDALEASLAPETVAKAYVEHASDRSGILFAPTVESAYTFAEELNVQGIKTEVVHGALEMKERRAILARLESGETQVIANCMVLTEGFDCPRVSCIVVARPTKSAPLYQQMVGRGLRVDPSIPREGQDCLILDVVGISARHTLASLIDLSEEKEWKKILCEEDPDCVEELEEEEGETEPSFFGPEELHNGPVVAVDFDPLASASSRVWLKTAGDTWFLSAGTQEGVYVFIVPATPTACECDGCFMAGDFGACVNGLHMATSGTGGNTPCRECGGSLQPSDPDDHAKAWTVVPGTGLGDAPAPGTYDVMWCTKSGYASHNGQRGGITPHRGINLEMAFAWGEDTAQEMGGTTGSMTLNKSSSWRKTKPSEKQLAMCKSRGIEVPEGASKGDVSALIDTQFASKRIDPIAAWFAQQSG